MSESKKLLTEVEMVDKLLMCVSSLIHHGLGSNYPGLNALFFLKLRLLGIDPQIGLVDDTEGYIRTLVQLVGGERMAEQLLRSVLPKRRGFEEVLKSLLSSRSRRELEASLAEVLRKHGRDLKSECKEVF